MADISAQSSTTWFVGRHAGSAEWIRTQNVNIDKYVEHLDEHHWPNPGDMVIGTLPVHIVASLNQQGVRFIHLKLNTTSSNRGEEMSATDLQRLAPVLVEYLVIRIEPSP